MMSHENDDWDWEAAAIACCKHRAAMVKEPIGARMTEFERLIIRWASRVVMTPAECEAQRRDFAYGNVKIHNDSVTRAMVDVAADRIASEKRK